jgi:hypothetical protein
MSDFGHLSMSQETRTRFGHLLDTAANLGIDRDAVSAAGPVALRALLALKNAAESLNPTSRDRYLAQVQDSLRILEHRKAPELVQQFQTRLLALQGRGSDTELAHVARGEIIVPIQLQNGDVLSALEKASASYGVPLEMLRVGTALNSINPETGAPEFGVLDWVSGLFNGTQPAQQPSSEPANASEFESLDFDADGPGEIRSALGHPIAALKAIGIRNQANKSALENFERDTLLNGAGDAYRHALTSSRLANALGPEIAKKFTDAHERSVPNSEAERLMDLTNNQIGRSFASGDDKADDQRILDAARKGQLKTLR